jgi:hypothetical protein
VADCRLSVKSDGEAINMVMLGALLEPEAAAQTVSFAPKTDFGTGSNPRSVAVGDFDGDGLDDPGIWRASTSVWIIPRSSANYGTFIFRQWDNWETFR